MFLKAFNLTAGYHLKSKVFSLLSKMIIYHNFTWLPSILQQKFNKCLDAILRQGQQQLLCTHLKCLFSAHFWPFWILLSVLAHVQVTDCHYIVRTLPGWLLLNQRCQTVETYQKKTKDIPDLGKNEAGEIYMCLTFIFF